MFFVFLPHVFCFSAPRFLFFCHLISTTVRCNLLYVVVRTICFNLHLFNLYLCTVVMAVGSSKDSDDEPPYHQQVPAYCNYMHTVVTF
jgi:hypothetical protein